MLRIYLKQAWNLLKQEKLFSLVYIMGTALSVTLVMVLTVVLYIRVANLYPETNRDRMLVVKSACVEHVGTGSVSSSSLSLHTIKTCFTDLKHAEAVSIVHLPWGEEHFVQIASGRQLPVNIQYVDDNYWKVFSFVFRNGVPFTEADVSSAIRTAVISETTARKLFGETSVAGRYFSLNFKEYRVAGVVKDASYALPQTYADIWIPYTLSPQAFRAMGENQALGYNRVYMVAPSVGERELLKREVEENIRRFASTFPEDRKFTLYGQPDKFWQSTLRYHNNQQPDFRKIVWQYVIIFLILLIIPAISLSGMIDSRMERRLVECGVRRAFGAPNATLMKQIISENMLFTFLGGFVGLFFSYLLLFIFRSRILEVGQKWVTVPVEGTEVVFTWDMLLNLPVFIIALFICFLLNLLSAMIPAWRASRRNIVYSLTLKN